MSIEIAKRIRARKGWRVALCGSWSALLVVAACGSGGGNDAASGGPKDSSAPAPDGSSVTDSGAPVESGLPPPPPDDAGVTGRSSIGWAVDYPDDVLDVMGRHAGAFTHVAVLIYDISSYTSGVAPFWNTMGGADLFQHGLTSAGLTAKAHGLGLKVLAAMSGGQEFGSNVGLLNILDDTPAGTQAGFIASMASEAAAKKYDGYALDLAMGGAPAGQIIDYTHYGAKMEKFLGAFRAALHAQKMVLTVAFVPNDVKQSCTSYGSGVFDLLQLGRYVDLAMLEAYSSTLGKGSSSCPAGYADPSGCFGGDIFGPFANLVDLLCSNTAQQAQMTVMMNAAPQYTNPFAGDAITLVETYGIPSVSLFPQINTARDGGVDGSTYEIYDTTGMRPAGSDWFTLLSGFVAHP